MPARTPAWQAGGLLHRCIRSQPECGGIADPAANAVEGAGAELNRHEYVARERAFDRFRFSGGESETRIVFRVANYDDDALVLPEQQLEAMAIRRPPMPRR